jgi:hypothetical protein
MADVQFPQSSQTVTVPRPRKLPTESLTPLRRLQFIALFLQLSTLKYGLHCCGSAVVALVHKTAQRERESEGVVVRDTTIERGNNNFLFEGSQALPASPSDRGEA